MSEMRIDQVETVIVAYTHHQPAQPTTLAHYLAAVENVLSAALSAVDIDTLRPQLVAELADALDASLVPDPDRIVSGRSLAASLTWDDAARRHLEFYARHPHPASPVGTHG